MDPSMQNEGEGGNTPQGVPRREFFRHGLRNLFESVAKVVGDRLERFQVPEGFLKDTGLPAPAAPPGDPALERRVLRPPGALKEDLFVERCQRSGHCVTSCPVQAIRTVQSEDGRQHGTPFIDPQIQACVVCEGLHCMRACPTGALSFVPRHLIQMGLAEVRYDVCVRSSGEDCQECVDKCPVGRSAIEIPHFGGRVEVKTGGCVGCGVCEMYCPTDPKAIVVR